MMSMLEKMRIATRLKAAFAAMIALPVVITSVGLIAVSDNQRRMEEITQVNNVKARLARLMRDTVYERTIALRNMALIRSTADMQVEVAIIKSKAAQ